MNFEKSFMVVLIFLMVIFCFGYSASADQGNGSDELLPGELIIKFKDDAFMSVIKSDSRVRAMKPIFQHVTQLSFQLNRSKTNAVERGFGRIYMIEFGKSVSMESMLTKYKDDPQVEYIQPNYIYKPDVTPNDPRYNEQYAHQLTQAEAAWDLSTGSSNVVIAVIGTGVDINHPDLVKGDYVEISSPDGRFYYTFSGKGKKVMHNTETISSFWATHIPGDTAIVRLVSKNKESDHGFVIDKWARGYEKGYIEAVMTGLETVSDKPYCTSSADWQSYEYIAGVEVGDLNNPSGPSPYSDFTSMVAHLPQGGTVNVALTPGFPISSYNEYWKIWIDYNIDGDFEDSGEEVFSGSGSSVVTGSFTVPASTILGDTCVRVSMYHNTYPPICGSFTFGEVEDYTVNIGNMIPAEPDFNNDMQADIVWRYYGTGGYNAVWLRGTATATASVTGIVPMKNKTGLPGIENAEVKEKKGKVLDNADMNISTEELGKLGIKDGFEGYAPDKGEGTNPSCDPFENELSRGVDRTMATVSDPRDDPEAVELPASANTDWKLCGTGDFNSDGKVDLVWRNVANGNNVVWYMDGVTRTGVGWLPATTNPDWALCGTGDFNGDNKVDLVWRNVVNGNNVVWYMDGLDRTGIGWLPTTTNLDWTLCGTGDFNNDGKPDLVWRNVVNGKNTVWFMDELDSTGVGWLPSTTNLDWVLCGIADFNNDGKDDLLWRNAGNGNNAIWYMDGLEQIGVELLTTVTDTTWKIEN